MSLFWLVFIVSALAAPIARGDPAQRSLERADLPESTIALVRGILKVAPLIDGHNDLPWSHRWRASNGISQIDLRSNTAKLVQPPMHTDLDRMRAGGIGAQFWSAYVPVDWSKSGMARAILEQIDLIHQLSKHYPNTFEMAYTAADIERIHAGKRIASLIGIEGGHSIEDSLALLRMYYKAGARYLTITHSRNTSFADAATDTGEHDGLTTFGAKVVSEMNRMGMMVDLSHTSIDTMNDALAVSLAPVIFSHSSARAVCDDPRNVPDDILHRLKANRGIIMVTFYPRLASDRVRLYEMRNRAENTRLARLHPGEDERIEHLMRLWEQAHAAPDATLSDVIAHIDHIRAEIGIDHIGIGGDFEGFLGNGPIGLEDVSGYPRLLAALYEKGYSVAHLKKLAGGNLLRVFREAEQVSRQLSEHVQ